MKNAYLMLMGAILSLSIALWVHSKQRDKTSLLSQRLQLLSSQNEELERLRADLENHPIPDAPPESDWTQARIARRDLFKLRGEARRIMEAAKWDDADLERLENETRSTLASIEIQFQQLEALNTLAEEGKKVDRIADGIAQALALALRKNLQAAFPHSLEALRDLVIRESSRPKMIQYYENLIKEMKETMLATGKNLSDFEGVHENRFFKDGRQRWFIRTKSSTQLPDGRRARPYWPVWAGDYNSQAHAEFRRHSDVHENLTHHSQLVYD